MSILRRATGPALVSWPVLVVTVVGSALISTLGTGSKASGSVASLALVGALGGLAAYLVVWVAWWGFLRRLSGTARIASAVIASAAAGVTRGLVVQWLFAVFGVGDADASQLVLRLVMGVIGGLFTFLGTAAGVASVRQYRDTIELLSAERQRLTALLDASVERIEQGQADTLARVQQRLDSEMRKMAVDSGPAAVLALESLAGDVVRPLSHTLARELPEWEHEVPSAVPRAGLREVWRGSVTSAAIRPLLLTVIGLVISLPAAVLVYEPRHGLLALFGGLAVLLVTLMMGRDWMRRHPPVTAPSGWVRVLIVLMGATVVASAVTGFLDRDDPSAGVFSVLGLIVVPTVGLVIAVVTMLGVRMHDTTADLQSVTRQLRWSLARVNTQQWEQNGVLSRALHGPVQALLHAQLLRLRRQVDGGGVDPSQLDTLREDLQRALTYALAPVDAPRSITDVLVDVADTWEGVARVTWQVSPRALSMLDQDRLCSHALTDLASEAVSNAVRHGGAGHVDVDVDVDEERDDLIRLAVVDDGRIPASEGAGLGTTLLTRCTYDWSLTREPTTLTARLPSAAHPDPIPARRPASTESTASESAPRGSGALVAP